MKFEEKLNRLEKISQKMREEEISLEDSVKSFEEGMEIAKDLEKELESYEKRVQILLSKDGEDHLEDFK